MCNDYTCVHQRFRCDGVDDCNGAEDEMHCGAFKVKVIGMLVLSPGVSFLFTYLMLSRIVSNSWFDAVSVLRH